MKHTSKLDIQTHRLIIWILAIIIATSSPVFAQPINDDCFGSIRIADPVNYCSGTAEFTTLSATDGGLVPASCFGGPGADVWFSFINTASSISVSIIGATGSGASLSNPEIELYISDCQNFNPVNGGLVCESDATGQNTVQLIGEGLVIGQTYFLRVQGRGNTGTFQFCMTNFFPPTNPESDCIDGSILCDKSSFTIEQIAGAGNDQDEAAGTCLGVGAGLNSEQRSVWYKWMARTSGSLTFTLTPTNRGDDLDFVVYELPSGINDCTGKLELRCNATFGQDVRCGDLTGLQTGETENMEPPGCVPNTQNGFLAPIDMIAGRSYGLLVNNFSTSGGGFSIEWGGAGEFAGPEPGFRLEAIGAFECDKTVTVTDESFSDVDNIVNWSWNFGVNAVPATGDGPGPFNIVYSSFGPKTVVLTLEGSLGCQVSTTQTIDVESCCADFVDLEINILEVIDNVCAGDSSGTIQVETINGDAPYQYSLNGGQFLPFDRFVNLPAGEYDIDVVDIKGCEATITVVISEPPPLELDLGEDRFIELGDRVPLTSQILPAFSEASIAWSPPTGLDCTDCFDPIASPFVTTTYSAMIVDSMGCTATDSVTIFVDPVRNIFIPNAFTPGVSDGTNDFFTIYGGKGTAPGGLLELNVFNRWGDIMFTGKNLSFGNQSPIDGWDGRFRGALQPTGVYVYTARVVFIDGVEIVYSGDLTLVR